MRSLFGGWLRPSHSIRSVVILGALFLTVLQAMTGYEIWRQYNTTIDQVIELTTLDLSTQAHRDPAETRQVMRDRAVGVPAIFGLMVVDGKGNALASMHAFSPRHQAFAETIRDEAGTSRRPFHIGEVRPDPFDSSPVIPFGRV
mgnify:CR=1 FL=1